MSRVMWRDSVISGIVWWVCARCYIGGRFGLFSGNYDSGGWQIVNRKVTMSKTMEILRLRYGLGLSMRQIALVTGAIKELANSLLSYTSRVWVLKAWKR